MSARLHRVLRLALASAVTASAVGMGGCGSLDWKGKAARPREVAEGLRLPQAAAGVKPPGQHSARIGRAVFYTDFPLQTNDAAFRDLKDLPDQIETELGVPTSDALIQVFLFDDEDKYHAFLKAKDPKLPMRSAYFFAEPGRGIGTGPELQVYTWTGPRLTIDLRHELTHALLHGTLKAVPLWLDEGLAGYFEQPPANAGINVSHLESLRVPEPGKPAFRGDLARLEKLKAVDQMGRPEYQEAWAWVHYMLTGDSKGRAVLLAYLQSLRTTPTPGLLLPKLEAAVGDAGPLLDGHLTKLDRAVRMRASR